MTRTTKITKRYQDTAEVWVGGTKWKAVRLDLYEKTEFDELPGADPFPGRTSWGGRIVGATNSDFLHLAPHDLELRLKAGTGMAVLDNKHIVGIGEAPF